jgi:hypothetical protein
MNPKLPNINYNSYDQRKSRINVGNESDQPSIRFVSMIDSKPVIPAYLNLVPLK